jgi:hypothetical protein
MKTYEGNLISTYNSETEGFLAPDGVTYSHTPHIGWQIVPKQISVQKTEEIIINSAEAKEFLISTDWKVIRHRDQRDMRAKTTLSDKEYKQLLRDRQAAREKLN